MLKGLMNSFPIPFLFTDILNDYPAGLHAVMRTDVKKTETGHEFLIDLPGYKKEDIKLSVKNGYMTVAAHAETEQDTTDGTKYVRRERNVSSCQRSYYVGEGVGSEDIKATFKDGVLVIGVTKKETLPAEERILIE